MTVTAPTLVALALSCLLPSLQAHATGWTPDSISLEAGRGAKVAMARLALQSRWEKRWFQRDGKHIGGYWDLSFARWRGNAFRDIPGQHQYLSDIGLTPVLRYQADDGKGWYTEGGIGIHRLSELYDNDNRELATRFQFGDHIGAGYVFRNGWDAGVKLQHFSNGGIKRPNSGINFLVFKVARAF
jgi:lipid A 3-O-deacylase